MSAANDNSTLRQAQGERKVRDLALVGFGLHALPVAGGAGVDLVAGGVHHAATVTLRTLAASSGKSSGFTGAGNRSAVAPPPAPPAGGRGGAIAGALAAMLNELPVRGGIVDRLA